MEVGNDSGIDEASSRPADAGLQETPSYATVVTGAGSRSGLNTGEATNLREERVCYGTIDGPTEHKSSEEDL